MAEIPLAFLVYATELDIGFGQEGGPALGTEEMTVSVAASLQDAGFCTVASTSPRTRGAA
jgi:hypothetical protein